MYRTRLKPPLNVRADISSSTRGLKFGLSLHLHPYFVYAKVYHNTSFTAFSGNTKKALKITNQPVIFRTFLQSTGHFQSLVHSGGCRGGSGVPPPRVFKYPLKLNNLVSVNQNISFPWDILEK